MVVLPYEPEYRAKKETGLVFSRYGQNEHIIVSTISSNLLIGLPHNLR